VSKRQRSTPVACAENRAKFTPAPSQVAPRGYGWPGPMCITLSSCVSRTTVVAYKPTPQTCQGPLDFRPRRLGLWSHCLGRTPGVLSMRTSVPPRGIHALLAMGHRQEQRNLIRFFLEFTALSHNICSKPHRHHGLRRRIPGRPGCLRMCETLWPVPLSQCR
jgi:hypothetical protein